ncbi:MAG: hypothetical protein ACRYFX_27585 [Janthinobacterium lividum]
MKKLLLTFAFVLTLLVGLTLRPAVAQCVMCKSQVEAARQEKDDYDVAGLNKGILYMMTVPYVLMGAIGFAWYRRTHPKGKTKQV